MRYFVSGGAGVIGMEMIPKLIQLGAEVFVGDLKPRPAIFDSKVRYRRGDLNSITKEEFDDFQPDIFIHLAATFERSQESFEFWHENFLHNLKLSHHLMTIAKQNKNLKRVVFASSYLIYSPSLYQFSEPIFKPYSLSEDDPVSPRNLTGMAKHSHEIELNFLNQFSGINFTSTSVRIFRGYGKGSRCVISRWIRSLINNEEITLYRPEGRFDYLYAEDAAEGLIRIANSQTSGIINLGTGKSRSVSEIVTILSNYFPNMKVVEGETDIPYESSEANISKLINATNWRPERDLEYAIPKIIDFEREKIKNKLSVSKTFIPKILLTSSSKKAPLIKSLKEAGLSIHQGTEVIAGDTNANAVSFYVSDKKWVMPSLENFEINKLITECQNLGVNTIIPTRDAELYFWASHKEIFKDKEISVLVSNLESIELCNDKLAFSEYGIKKGLPVIPSSLNPETLNTDRFVVKEQFGSGSRSIGMNLDIIQANSYKQELKNPIFQPYIKGMEISVDAWFCKNRKVKGFIMRKRDFTQYGESQVTTTFRNNYLEEQIKNFLSNLKLEGSVVLQAIINENNSINVIECNPRFGGASTTSIQAGLDMLRWSLLEVSGENIDNYPFIRSKKEITQIRIPKDLYFYDFNF